MNPAPERLHITLEYPSPWLEFPLAPEADVERWATTEAERIVGASCGPGDPGITRMLAPSATALRAELLARAREYRSRPLVFALGCYPPGIDTSDVGLEVGTAAPGADDPGRALAEHAERVAVRDLGEPDVRFTELPAGSAVRLRQNRPGRRKTWFAARTVLRQLEYGIVPQGQRALITLTTLWTDPTLDEHIEGWTDDIAATVQADPAP